MPWQMQNKLCTCNVWFVHLGVYELWSGPLALVGSSAWLAAYLPVCTTPLLENRTVLHFLS